MNEGLVLETTWMGAIVALMAVLAVITIVRAMNFKKKS